MGWIEAEASDGPDTESPDPEIPEPEGPETESPDPEGPDPEGPNPEGPDSEGPDPEGPDPEGPGWMLASKDCLRCFGVKDVESDTCGLLRPPLALGPAWGESGRGSPGASGTSPGGATRPPKGLGGFDISPCNIKDLD